MDSKPIREKVETGECLRVNNLMNWILYGKCQALKEPSEWENPFKLYGKEN